MVVLQVFIFLLKSRTVEVPFILLLKTEDLNIRGANRFRMEYYKVKIGGG
jgi:hypothetical protein